MKQTATMLIVALCVICAATTMSGCLEVDDHIETVNHPTVSSVFDEMEDNFAEAEDIKTQARNVLELRSDLTIEIKSTIPDDYYDIVVDQYFIDHKMYNYLDGYTWNIPLIRGAGWGLPEAAELEHELSEMGCNVSIRCANVRTTIDHSEFENRVLTDGYARSCCLPTLDQVWTWLMIEYNGEIVAYEVYGSYWVFKPDSVMKDEYVSDGKWHDWWNYKENMTWIYDGNTWTMYGFKDFSNIYELEEYYLSGGAREDCINRCKNGQWCSYYTSNDYNATDHFLIEFGWWMTEEEYHETETRINEATEWFTLINSD